MRIEAGIGGFDAALGRPEQADLVAVAPPDRRRRAFALVGQRMDVAAIIVADRLVEFEVPPAALAGEGELARDRRAADDGERDPLLDVGRGNVERADERGAHRAGPLALGPVHPEIGEQRVVPAEQVDEADLVALLVEEAIILRDRTRRQRAALRGDALDLAAQLDLLGEQGGARLAIVRALARPAGGAGFGQFRERASGPCHPVSPLRLFDSQFANRI